MSSGVLYIALGADYVEEAIQSAASLRRQMPGINIAIATPDKIDAPVFDHVIEHESDNPGVGKSIMTPQIMPYDKTLFLDTDTYIAKPIDELFEILDSHDMCFARGNEDINLPPPYHAWKEFNTGVVGYRANDRVRAFLQTWSKKYSELYQTEGVTNDQPAFGLSVFESDIRYYVLPRRFNCRLPRVGFVGDEIKIGHGRMDGVDLDLRGAVERLNETPGPRVYGLKIKWNLKKTMAAYTRGDSLHRSWFRKFLWTIRQHGIRHMMRAAKSRLGVGRS